MLEELTHQLDCEEQHLNVTMVQLQVQCLARYQLLGTDSKAAQLWEGRVLQLANSKQVRNEQRLRPAAVQTASS